MRLSREKVLGFLREARPDLSEADWRIRSDLITVLSWALPAYAKQQLRADKERIAELTRFVQKAYPAILVMANDCPKAGIWVEIERLARSVLGGDSID